MNASRIESSTTTDHNQRTYPWLWALAAVVVVAVVVVSVWPSVAEGPTIDVGDGSWTAIPTSVAVTADSHTITVTNSGTETEGFAVLRLRVAPDALPVRDSGPNMWHEGGEFHVAHPAYEHVEGEGVTPNPLEYDTIEPGQEKTITIGDAWKGAGGPGTYLVISSEPGAYQSGMYVVYTLTEG